MVVPKQFGKVVASLELGKCKAICEGCGCNGGPGFRSPAPGRSNPKGDCVSFQNINSVCGPPPHRGCKAECTAVIPACLNYGRSWLAVNASKLNLSLNWMQPERELPRTEQPPEPPRQTPPAGAGTPDAVSEKRRPRVEGTLIPSFTTEVYQCGVKRTCREMRSCDEAKFHHAECGLTHLDGTGNGVPCKTLCAR